MNYNGSFYTWCNNRRGSQRQHCKLDRVLVNSLWIQSHITAKATFGGFEVSDHTPCVIVLKTDAPPTHMPFKFCDAWVHHPDFFLTVREAWSIEIHECHMYRLVQRLKLVKQKLKRLHKSHFGNIDDILQQIPQNLQVGQENILESPLNEEWQLRDQELKSEYKRLLQTQVGILKQRAKLKWVQ